MDIDTLRLTEDEFVRCIERNPIEAQLAKAIYGIADWFLSDEAAEQNIFDYGGPTHCEYGCLNLASQLIELAEQANIERPGKNVEVAS